MTGGVLVGDIVGQEQYGSRGPKLLYAPRCFHATTAVLQSYEREGRPKLVITVWEPGDRRKVLFAVGSSVVG